MLFDVFSLTYIYELPYFLRERGRFPSSWAPTVVVFAHSQPVGGGSPQSASKSAGSALRPTSQAELTTFPPPLPSSQLRLPTVPSWGCCGGQTGPSQPGSDGVGNVGPLEGGGRGCPQTHTITSLCHQFPLPSVPTTERRRDLHPILYSSKADLAFPAIHPTALACVSTGPGALPASRQTPAPKGRL